MTAPLAISLGDPAGVGPEIIADCWSRREALCLPPFVVMGGADVLVQAAASRGFDLAIELVSSMGQAAEVFSRALPVLDSTDGTFSPGEPSEDGAAIALQSLEQAAKLTLDGQACAMVTAPVSKSQLAKVGFAFPGQTEFITHACGIDLQDGVMMLAGPGLKTVPLTVHCAISEVSGLLSSELIIRRCRVVAKSMSRDFGIARPHLAVAGLNPHAGEKGRMGAEEEDIIAPAIAALQAEGINATGPYPADTLFAPHMRGTYDIAIAMYHDQALVPLKTLYFDEGVNMTLGLPIIRTSPDHGTAFDIAGKNIARPDSMIAAIRMAGEAAAQRAQPQ